MITTLGAFLGGLGLFLLAISMITSGLKVAAETDGQSSAHNELKARRHMQPARARFGIG